MAHPGRGRKHLIAGLVCVLGGAISGVVSLPFLIRHFEPLATMESPGEAEFEAPEAGPYTLWHDHRTTFAGRRIHNAAQLPSDLSYKMMRKSDGAVVTMQPSNFSEPFDFTSRKAAAVGEFELVGPGTYVLHVENPSKDQRVFSVTSGPFLQNFMTFLMLFLVGGVMGVGGIGLTIYGIVLLASNSDDVYGPPVAPTA